jgi:hypothetical protein
MSLVSSGAISLFDVNTELGLTRTSQIGLLCSSVRSLFGDASGAVAMFDGYGKSSAGSIIYCTPGTYSWTAPAGVTSVSVLVVQAGYNGNCQTYNPHICSYNGSTDYVVVGIPYGGQGGALAWRNNISVTPGSTYPIYVGAPGYRSSFNYVSSSCLTKTVIASPNTTAPAPYSSVGDGYSWGGCGVGSGHYGYFPYTSNIQSAGGGAGGGAAGYNSSSPCRPYYANRTGGSAQAGVPCAYSTAGLIMTGLNGGGGAGNVAPGTASGGGGGGVGLYGQGSNGGFNGAVCAVGHKAWPNLARGIPQSEGGGGGSGGSAGSAGGVNNYSIPGGNGGNYGGGGGAGGDGLYHYNPPKCYYTLNSGSYGGTGGKAAVRIIWPGCSRTFPSTNVGSP